MPSTLHEVRDDVNTIIHLHTNVGFVFFFNDTATTEIYTLSLHDALPISLTKSRQALWHWASVTSTSLPLKGFARGQHDRSEEHTSELQSHLNLVCRLLLEKKK